MQITDTIGGITTSPRISADGFRIAFVSDRDLTGENPDSNLQIFLWDQDADFTQITRSQGGGRLANFDPAISGDGTRIAFASNRDHRGTNPDGNTEIFLWTDGSGITQITDTRGPDSGLAQLAPAISADGLKIFFMSNRDLIPMSNPDGNMEIFRWMQGGFTQITNTTGTTPGNAFANAFPSTNRDGTRVAFESDRNLTGQNPDGSVQIFLWAVGPSFIQITRTTRPSGLAPRTNAQPSITADGSTIAFVSNRNLTGDHPHSNFEAFLWVQDFGFLSVTTTTGVINNQLPAISADSARLAFQSNGNMTGGNPDANVEIYAWDSDAGLTQITNTIGGGGGFLNNDLPSMSGDASRIAFVSNRDLTQTGRNADNNFEIFLWAPDTGFRQITDTRGGLNTQPSINRTGTRIAFVSNRNLTMENPDSSFQIFLWIDGTGFRQLTNSRGGITFQPSISRDGTRVAFISDRNLTGQNPGLDRQVFLWVEGMGLRQITTSTGGGGLSHYQPAISGDGRRIAFSSNRNPTGQNPDGNHEIFLWTEGSGIAQITDSTGGAVPANMEPAINFDGTRIAFVSNRNLTGVSDGSYKLFYWVQGMGIRRLTDPNGGFSRQPSITSDGRQIAFRSNRNLAGGNPNLNPQIFLWTDGAGFQQVTTSATPATNLAPTIDEGGSVIAFVSDGDFSRINSDGNQELFLAGF
jgi:Tol biopolymer transport system component